MPWFKCYALPLIEGSITQTMTDTQQLIWLKLIALARISKMGDGTLRHGEGIPMSDEWIARRLGHTLEDVQNTIEICLRDKNHGEDKYRMKRWGDGTLELCNFLSYNPPMQHTKESPSETPDERRMRELRQLSVLQRKYPQRANLEVTERITVDSSTGEVMDHRANLKDPVAPAPEPHPGGNGHRPHAAAGLRKRLRGL